MTDRRTGPAAALAASLFLLAGCDTIGNPLEALTQKKPGPDEFAVITRGELVLPPTLGASVLPEPAPGAPSPRDPDPRADAVAVLTGSRTAPGAPASTSISRGEAALLAAADASASSPDIRALIAAENVEYEDSKPYEPPTLWELFTGTESLDEEDLVDPVAEARRLQAAGVAAPTDRTALEREAALAEEARQRGEQAAAAEAAPSVGAPRFRGPVPVVGQIESDLNDVD